MHCVLRTKLLLLSQNTQALGLSFKYADFQNAMRHCAIYGFLPVSPQDHSHISKVILWGESLFISLAIYNVIGLCMC
jgi:hypothetical protein